MRATPFLLVAGLAASACQAQSTGTVLLLQAGGADAAQKNNATPGHWYTHEAAEKLYRAGKYTEALDLCKQAIDEITKTRGPKAPELAAPLIDTATVQMRLAKYTEAKATIERAEALLDKSKPDQALLLARLGINKGWRLYTFGDTAAALKVFEESRDLITKNKTGDSVDLAELINNIGLMQEDVSETRKDAALMVQARRSLNEAWQMRRRLTGEDSPETVESMNNMGMHMLFHGRTLDDRVTGIDTLRQAKERTEKVYGKEHAETASAHATFAMANLVAGEIEVADREIRLAMPMTLRILGPKHPDRSFELIVYGRILTEQLHFDEAEKAIIEAIRIDEDLYGKSHKHIVGGLSALKELYTDKGDSAGAEKVQKRIEEIQGKDI